MQTSEQLAAFRKLCEENGLGKADVWQHKQSSNWIMSRAGAEKVQGRNNIQIEIEVCAAAIDFAVVKATATRTLKPEGAKVAKKISVQTLGSANPKNCTQISYYAEMAEKRAKVRAVLMLMGFYELGVYGEEEAEDFARSRSQAPEQQPRPSVPAAQEPTPPASTAPAPFITPEESLEEEPLTKVVVVAMLKDADTLDDLRSLWQNEAKPYHNDLDVFDAKETRKNYLQLNQKLA